MTAQQLNSRLNEAIAHHNAGRLERAEAIYRQLAPIAPRNSMVFELWGQLAEQQGRPDDAIRYYMQARRVAPCSVAANVRLAGVFIAGGRLAEAEATVRQFTERAPKSWEAWNALGFALKVRGKLGEALECHKRAVELNPKFVEGWCHFGLTYGAAGRNQQALQQYERALAIDAKHWPARYGRAQSLHKIYRMDEAVAEYDAVVKAEPNNLEARSYRLFALQGTEISREQLFAEHVAYGKALGGGPAVVPGHDRSLEKRLRVAVLSADLRTHSCAYYLEPMLQHLDPAQFEIYLYHDHYFEDAMSARLRKYAAVWRNFVGQPQDSVERTIRADRPDILIDLCGHIGNIIRLPVFAKRVAPVQITYLGYPDTTGVGNMDFRFTDAIADPVGEADRFAVEKLVRFAPTAWAYQPPVEAPEVARPPCASGAAVTFGCFNSPTKFTTSLFKAWAQLLAEVPSSRLVLKARDFDEPEVRAYMLKRIEAAGVPIDRLELLTRTYGTGEHLAQYGQVDIALDSFPYAGTTTTCEALWMGRPVVSLCGDRHAARVGASLLTAIGHTEWIARDANEYVKIAATLAGSPAVLESASAQLRQDMLNSPLLDHTGQCARFAAALRECWREKVVPKS
jgi:protein O-GlcNAc transferase